jgi:hypothetical protein
MVAELAGQIVGAAVCDFDPHRHEPAWPRGWANLGMVVMGRREQSFGLGQALIAGAAAAARAKGAIALGLHLAELGPSRRAAEVLRLVRAPVLDFDETAAEETEVDQTRRWPVQAWVMSLA